MNIVETILLLDAAENSELESLLRERAAQVICAESPVALHELSLQAQVDLIIADFALIQRAGGAWNARETRVPLIILADPDAAGAALQWGRETGCGVLLKPFVPATLDIALVQAERLRQCELIRRRLNTSALGEWLGVSPQVQALRDNVRKIARTHATVLIEGERGSGKSFVARQVHSLSPRAAGPFLTLDCTALTDEELAQELFGGPSRKHGLLQLAHQGTLVLDEISRLAPEAQERLLRYLAEGMFERTDGGTSFQSDVRVIATTTRNLAELSQRGEFREDLFIRLSIVPIAVPPLRDRKTDVRIFADHFRQVYSRKHGLDVLAMSPAAVSMLECHTWPANIRELEQVIEQGLIAAESGVIEPGHFRLHAKGERVYWPASKDAIETLADCEKRHIFAVLERCQWNRTHAADKLAISVRTLRNKLKEYREQAQGSELVSAES